MNFHVFDSKDALEIIAFNVQCAKMLLHKSSCSSDGKTKVALFNMPKYILIPQECPQQQNVSCGANVILIIKSVS